MSFTLAIVGRPNVGKSTLFNRLAGRKLALVDDRPGVTRDLREAPARLGDLAFTVMDTAGIEEAEAETLTARMRALTERAIGMADACLFLVDARAGVTPADHMVADLLRRGGRPVILAANKAEGKAGEAGALEAWELGLGEVLQISGEHGEGMSELYAALLPLIEGLPAEEPPEEGAEPPPRPIQIAVIGRPNAGKSTLVNAILGEDRLLTGPEAGITRDAISVEVTWDGTPMRIFDTAGMRKRAKVQEKLEKLSVSDGLRAVRFADVVIVLADALAPFETQDLRLADLIEREGRAVVLAVSKWDLVEEKSAEAQRLREEAGNLLPQIRGAPVVFVSGLTGKGLDRLRAAILQVHAAWTTRISTSRLNRWLEGQVEAHPPPAAAQGRRIRLRYMTQVKARPPTFVLFCSAPEDLPESYLRFLTNGLRETFELWGTPIRFTLRKGENPFEGRAGGRRGE